MTVQYEEIMADIHQELGLDRLPVEKQEELLTQMGEVLMKRIFVDTMEKLGETGMNEYETFMNGGPSQEDLEVFLKGKIPDYENFVAKIVSDFKGEMKG